MRQLLRFEHHLVGALHPGVVPPELVFGSDASVALTTYLAGRANGAPYDGPAIKR